jgi:hypothetical protein
MAKLCKLDSKVEKYSLIISDFKKNQKKRINQYGYGKFKEQYSQDWENALLKDTDKCIILISFWFNLTKVKQSSLELNIKKIYKFQKIKSIGNMPFDNNKFTFKFKI